MRLLVGNNAELDEPGSQNKQSYTRINPLSNLRLARTHPSRGTTRSVMTKILQ